MMTIQEITPQQAVAIFQKQNALFIDVREPLEHANQHIPGSVLHPLNAISAQKLPQSDHYLIYCQKGVRGRKACERVLLEKPNLTIYNLQGGIEAWQQAGLITQALTKNTFPLKQQVQIFLGLLILSFSLFALLISSVFIYATLLLGTVFMIAGFTGLTGLSKLLAKMPWNKNG